MSVDGLHSHSYNRVVSVFNENKKIPFVTRFYNRPIITTSTDSLTCTDDRYASSLDINTVVNRYLSSGVPFPSLDDALYGFDLSGDNAPGNFEGLVNKLESASENFMKLPSSLRSMFDNDVSKFALYLSNSSDDDIKSLLKEHKVFKEEFPPAVGCPDLLKPDIDSGAMKDAQDASIDVSAP